MTIKMKAGISPATSRVRKWRSVTVLALGIWALRIFAVPLVSAGKPVLRGEDLRVITDPDQQAEARDMLPRYFRVEVEKATEARLARLKSIHTLADFAKWQQENRKNFLDLIGGLPSERTPLNPRFVGEIHRDGYVVRKIIFESLPEFYVTANLYVPTMGIPPYPAVLAPIGHSRNGKAYANYQHLFIDLAKSGYAVLTWDPQGQGERLQYWDFINGGRRFPFNQHAMAGLQEYLLGQNLARYFIWDGIRALDYLTSLREVDANRVGCTGNSGGGTLTTYISMLDERIKAASIVTFLTSIPMKIEARALDAESDPEQDIAGLLSQGIDHTEMAGMIAPRPVLLGAALRDFFPIAGTRQTFLELQELYQAIGAQEKVSMVAFDHPHMYSRPLREATVNWFNRWLKNETTDFHEGEWPIERDEALACTPTGQVVTSLGGRRMVDLNREKADGLDEHLESLRKGPDYLRGLPQRIRARLSLGPLPAPRVVRKDGESAAGDFSVVKLVLETEPGIRVPVRMVSLRSAVKPSGAVLYLRDRQGTADELELVESLARDGRLVAVADVRGFGETWSPRTVEDQPEGYYAPRDGVDADFTYASFFLGRPLLGMRVKDALEVFQYLRSLPEVRAGSITLVGRGGSALIALFAAAAEPAISRVAIEGAPPSYSMIAHAELYNTPASLLVPGMLEDFDLPDVLASIAPRRVFVANPVDAMSRNISRNEAERELKRIVRISESPAAGAVTVRVLPGESDFREELLRVIRTP